MTPAPFTLLIPNKIPGLVKADRKLQRIIATLLLLRSRFPEGRFNFRDMKAVSELCGFQSRKGFKQGHLDALQAIGLITYQKTAEHYYVVFASWDNIKKHFNYDRTFFLKYQVDSCSANDVLDILFDLAVQGEQAYFHRSMRANLNGNPELLQSIKDVCGDASRAAIHHYQLKAYTKGIEDKQDEEQNFMCCLLLHSTKTPKAADGTEPDAKRFFIKGDTNVSTGYLSRAFNYKHRNGVCYRKKRMQQKNLVICKRREYVVDAHVRTKTLQRITGIGNTFWDWKEKCLKLRLVDEWQFISPSVAFSRAEEVLRRKKAELNQERTAETSIKDHKAA